MNWKYERIISPYYSEYKPTIKLTSTEIYKKVVSQDKELKKKITLKKYKRIIKAYNAALIDELVETGVPIKLPYAIGVLAIIGRRNDALLKMKKENIVKSSAIDWVNTKKYGKKIIYTNMNTNGYIFRIYMKMSNSTIVLKDFWSFFSCFHSKKRLANKLKEDPDFCLNNYIVYNTESQYSGLKNYFKKLIKKELNK